MHRGNLKCVFSGANDSTDVDNLHWDSRHIMDLVQRIRDLEMNGQLNLLDSQ